MGFLAEIFLYFLEMATSETVHSGETLLPRRDGASIHEVFSQKVLSGIIVSLGSKYAPVLNQQKRITSILYFHFLFIVQAHLRNRTVFFLKKKKNHKSNLLVSSATFGVEKGWVGNKWVKMYPINKNISLTVGV